MKISLKIVGEELFSRLNKDVASGCGAFPRIFMQRLVSWDTVGAPVCLTPEELVCSPDTPSILLIGANDTVSMTRVRAMERQMLSHFEENVNTSLIPCPVIAIFPDVESLSDLHDLPEQICDWTFFPIVMPDLARRALVSLKRRSVLKTRLQCGALALIPESRSVTFGDRSSRLTPSEYTLAELFLSHMGTVISFSELAQRFKATGKSAEPNNIRVAIFQLRLKLEMLTKSQVMLSSVYKKGYCLSQRTPRPLQTMRMPVSSTTRVVAHESL